MFEKNLNFSDAMKLALAFALVFVSLILFFITKDILITFLVAIIFAIALDRPIDKLVEKKISRSLSVIFIYTVFLLIIGIIFYIVIPPFGKEMSNLATNIPTFLQFLLDSKTITSLSNSTTFTQYYKTFSEISGANSQIIFEKIFDFFGGFVSFLIIFFVAFFLNIQKNGVRHIVFLLVPKKHLEYANNFFNKTQDNVNNWLWGKILCSIIVGIILYFGLLFIKIPYAISLSILAIILNFIPFIGSLSASIIPIFLGLSISIPHGIAVALLYFITNNVFESLILLPIFMKRAINMNPALMILFVLIGGRLAGILGIIISIPIAAIASLIINEYLNSKNISAIEKE